MTKEEKTLKEQ